MILKKNLIKNRWSEQQKAEEEARKERKHELAQQNLPRQKRAIQMARKGNDNIVPLKKDGPSDAQINNAKSNAQPYLKTSKSVEENKKNRNVKQTKQNKTNFVRSTKEKFKSIKSKPDFMLLQITMILLAVGLVMVLSASSYEGLLTTKSQDGLHFFKRQLLFAVLGMLGMFFMMAVSNEAVRRFSKYFLGLFIILILVAMVFSDSAYGAQRWIELKGVKFNPSDFAKPFVIVVYANYLENVYNRLNQMSAYIKAFGLMILLPTIVAVEDLGTAIVFFGGLFAMLIVAGAPRRFTLPTVGIGLIAFAIAVIAKPYRLTRITSFLNPFREDLNDAGSYQLQQSLYAFGDGGFFGVGLGNGGQKMSHLFASHTDFIYSIIGEELGFIGAFCVLALFVAFTWRGFWISMRIRDFYKSIVVFGLTAFIGGQALINMGVAIGVLPVTGITLPFISYGGSSLLVSLAMVGYILNLSRYMERNKKRKS